VKLFLFLVGLLPCTVLAQAPLLPISNIDFTPPPVAVPLPFTVDEGGQKVASAFDEAFLFDLRASGALQVLNRAGFTADPKEGMTAGSINFSRWSDVGAELLVKVQLGAEGGTLRGELRLFNVGNGREALKVAHDVPANEPRQLAHLLADALYRHLTREPSPFLSRITFVRKAGSNRDVWVADWDGNNARALTNGGINLLPALGPGGVVGFTSYRKGRPDLYAQRPGEDARPVVQNGQMATGIAWSPDGKKIAYALAEGESTQLYVANADGSSPKAITDTPYGINSSPAWSPDGKRIAFVSNRGGSPQLYVMNADGSNPKRLTFQGNYNQTPDWSPRGDLIAFTARDERNAFDLFTVNVDSGKITRLTQDQGNNEEPVFSPNGRLILFTTTRDGAPRLYVMTADGNTQLALPMEKGGGLTPDWAPAP
jgi:TolB protein